MAYVEWWTNSDNVWLLGAWLVHEKDYDAQQILSYFEKPWHYTDERIEMEKEDR